MSKAKPKYNIGDLVAHLLGEGGNRRKITSVTSYADAEFGYQVEGVGKDGKLKADWLPESELALIEASAGSDGVGESGQLDAKENHPELLLAVNGLLNFIGRTATEDARIVSTGDLSVLAIAEARADNRMFVNDEGLGFVLLPWYQSTEKDRAREEKLLNERKGKGVDGRVTT